MELKDRFTRGFIAGVTAGIFMFTIDLIIFYVFGYSKQRYLDLVSELLIGRMPETVFEMVFAQLAQLIFNGFMGVIFAFLIIWITSSNYLLKGWVYATISWFFIYAMGIAFKIPSIHKVAIQTAVSHFITSSIYGLILGYTLYLLDKRVRL